MLNNPSEIKKESYLAMAPKIGPRQNEILSALNNIPIGLTAWDLSERLGRMIHVVRPRLTELNRMGLILADGARWQVKTSRMETVWRVA